RELRVIIIGTFGLIMCLPMIFTFLPPKPSPVAYPPYLPPLIQRTALWMKENELIMSDMPWAVAWYAQRQCLWLTLDADAEFFAVNDFLKPVRALYLTPQRSEEHTSELQSRGHLVCRLLLEKKKNNDPKSLEHVH